MANIGVFDSGVGGLTVARAIYNLNKYDKLIYFGDIAHLPYGDKSAAAIQSYSVRIAEFLVAKGCETIVIACNSASASATDLLKEYLDHRIKVVNVIDPMVDHVINSYGNSHIGLIGTKRTIDSEIYQQKISGKSKNVTLSSMATPLLVPVIEENLFSSDLKRKIIEEYLHYAEFRDLDALILGCTHYPIIKNEIQSILGEEVDILDSSEIVAEYLKANDTTGIIPNTTKAEFYVSDVTDFFRESANRFFANQVNLKVHHLVNIY